MTAPASVPGADEVRAEVRGWLAAHWDADLGLAEWRALLADSGWGAPTWPQRWYGRALPAALASVVAAEFARVDAVGGPEGVGPTLAAPTLLEHGSDDLLTRCLRPTLTGDLRWCQLFSEPGAGSDLAGLTTRAVRDGDAWVVTGQKVWNTSAHHADVGLLLARTDWDVPKHRGITYFVLPMRQPGVEVRPLRQMNGYASFNEVFLDAARIPVGNVVGEVGGGWTVALTTLAHERRLAAGVRRGQPAERQGRCRREAAVEAATAAEPYRWYPQRAGRPDLLVERAIASGRAHDPLVRREVARATAVAWTARWNAQRAAAARAAGRPPGPEGSLGKLASSNIARAAARVHALLAGPAGMLAGADAPLGGLVGEILLSVPAVSIAGGTDDIQRTIIGERILGLPKEPVVDRDVQFRTVARNNAHPAASDAVGRRREGA
jgi:alkylation response protein AidB-like acyl-CoA dehydrogenase